MTRETATARRPREKTGLVGVLSLVAGSGSALAANPSGNLDQCGNGALGSPVPCNGNAEPQTDAI